MISLIIMLCVTVYGIYYAVNPMPSLKRKFKNRDVPRSTIRAARVSGVVLAVLGVAFSVFFIVRMVLES